MIYREIVKSHQERVGLFSRAKFVKTVGANSEGRADKK